MTRIAIGGLMHESNTFAGARTDSAAFEAGGLETGQGIARRWGKAHHEIGGFLSAAQSLGFEAVPALMGWATPAGPVTAEAFGELTGRLLAQLQAAGPVDAVLLALHGAMVADGTEDADGTILSRVRELIGPGRPLVATLDYHGNVSPLMVEASDAILAYQTYPHVDQWEKGKQAAALALLSAQGKMRPAQALAKPPLFIPLLAQETDRPPMRQLLARCREIEVEPRCIGISLLAGFPYADVASAGPSCVAVAHESVELARERAEMMAEAVWNERHALTDLPLGPAEAVAQALASDRTPVVLVDLGDNIGGGSAADSTVLIHELRRQGATGAIVVLYDPGTVRACEAAGMGVEIDIHAGGHIDRHAPPLEARGRVRLLHEGRYEENEPRHGGIRFNDQGRTAVIDLADGNTVVVSSRRHPPFSLGQLTSLGLDPAQARVLVVKAAVAYKAAYLPIAGTILEVDTPGLTAANPARFRYRRVQRPILPLDPEPLVEQRWLCRNRT